MAQNTFRFVAELARGRLVDMHYLPEQLAAAAPRHYQYTAPHFTVSMQRYEEIQKSAPRKFSESTFRIVEDYGKEVDLEWIT